MPKSLRNWPQIIQVVRLLIFVGAKCSNLQGHCSASSNDHTYKYFALLYAVDGIFSYQDIIS